MVSKARRISNFFSKGIACQSRKVRFGVQTLLSGIILGRNYVNIIESLKDKISLKSVDGTFLQLNYCI